MSHADTSPPADAPARRRAATDVATNLVVAAGAGTGKTSLLVERVLTAIARGTAPLSEIVAITFTDRAAGELRERIASGLEELRARARGERPDEGTPAFRAFGHATIGAGIPRDTVGDRALAGLRQLDRATLSTIHGFCSEILRRHPLLSGLPPGFAIDRGAISLAIAEAAWTRFLEEELGPEGRRVAVWTRALERLSLSDLAALAGALAGGAVPDAVVEGPYRAVDLLGALDPEARRLAAELATEMARLPELTKAPRTFVEGVRDALTSLAAHGFDASRNLPDFESKSVSKADSARLRAVAARGLALLRAKDEADDATVAAALEAVAPFVRRLRTALEQAGLADFDALLVKTRDLLRDHPEIRARERARFRMLLVDEFQDTDPVQYEIVLFLAERTGSAAASAYGAPLEPGRLFIVGDAKQSIYRFRGADYAAYDSTMARVLEDGGARLALTSNFRSVPGVLRAVNGLFTSPGTPWRPSEVLPAYEPIVPEREEPPSQEPAVEVWTMDLPPRTRASERRRAEALAIAAEVARIAGEGRPYRHGDVLVLFRGFSEVPLYLRAFREAGFPFVVSGGRRFHERTEIAQTLAVLRAVADASDQVALLAYLRSPAGGVTDLELRAHAATGGTWRADAVVDPHACPGLASAFDRLRRLQEEAPSLPVDVAVRRVLDRTGLLALGALAFEGAQRVANIEKLARTAAELSRDGRLGLRETLDTVERVFAADAEADSPLADETADAVRVMTIHKAKGLEAKIVVLADAAAGRRGARDRDDWRVRIARTSRAEDLAVSGPRVANGAATLMALADARHDEAEGLRLLYVALTRARDRLIVLAGKPASRSPWIEALAMWGYDPDRPPEDGAALADGAVRHRRVPPLAPGRPPRVEHRSGAPEAVAAWRAATAAETVDSDTPSARFRSPSLSDVRLEADDVTSPGGSLESSLARSVGALVHTRLERFPTDDEGLLERATDADDDVARESEAILRTFAGSTLASRLSSLDVVGREVPLLLEEPSGVRWRGTIDLLYRDGDDSLVVADFKTDTSLEGAARRHHEQLRVYAEAVRRVMPRARVRAELWMLRHGTVVAVPV